MFLIIKIDMKKITPREMTWINKGNIKNLSYNRFEAKGRNSCFLAVSDENFEVSNTVSLNSRNYSFIVSITERSYFSLNIGDSLSVTTSINNYKSETNIDNKYIDNKKTIEIKLERVSNSFSFYIDNIFITKATLPSSKEAISFGYYFNNSEFIKVTDFLYIKK